MSTGDEHESAGEQTREESAEMGRPPIDLQKRRLARELEGELGGLFGIELPDIESAIQRLYEDFATGQYDERARLRRLPEPLHAVIQSLDRIYEIARLESEAELEAFRDSPQADQAGDDPANLAPIIELVENYLERLKKLPGGSREL